MTIKDFHDQTNEALKAGDSLRLMVLRMLVSELNYKKIELQHDLTEEDIFGVIKKEVKKRKEAIEGYTSGGRHEQAEQEEKELAILSAYLPQMMGEEQLREDLVKNPLIVKGADFGQVMKGVSPMYKGKVDGAMLAKLVRDLISE